MLAKNANVGLLARPRMYASALIGGSSDNLHRDVFFFEELAKEINFNFNTVAESELLNKVLNLTLPSVKNAYKFRVSFKEDYLSPERFMKMRANNFAIGSYFPEGIKAHSLIYSNTLKKEERLSRLKIRLVTNAKPLIGEFMTVKNLIAGTTDAIIFITGGGFIADMEKVAQYWLRQ